MVQCPSCRRYNCDLNPQTSQKTKKKNAAADECSSSKVFKKVLNLELRWKLMIKIKWMGRSRFVILWLLTTFLMPWSMTLFHAWNGHSQTRKSWKEYAWKDRRQQKSSPTSSVFLIKSKSPTIWCEITACIVVRLYDQDLGRITGMFSSSRKN